MQMRKLCLNNFWMWQWEDKDKEREREREREREEGVSLHEIQRE